MVDNPDEKEVAAAMASVEKATWSGIKKGLYPRWIALIVALGTGATAALFISENPAWIILFIGGLIGFYLWGEKKGAWINEVRSRQDLGVVILLSLILIAIVLGGFLAAKRDISWAPFVSGLLVALLMYLPMEIAYHGAWSRMKRESS